MHSNLEAPTLATPHRDLTIAISQSPSPPSQANNRAARHECRRHGAGGPGRVGPGRAGRRGPLGGTRARRPYIRAGPPGHGDRTVTVRSRRGHGTVTAQPRVAFRQAVTTISYMCLAVKIILKFFVVAMKDARHPVGPGFIILYPCFIFVVSYPCFYHPRTILQDNHLGHIASSNQGCAASLIFSRYSVLNKSCYIVDHVIVSLIE